MGTGAAEEYKGLAPGSEELVSRLVEEHTGWATAIARSVARSWNLDWQLDGLDGGAYEGLLFCARRYDPSMGVPFRAYARRRIHEASTEEARKSKSWQQGVGANTPAEQNSREISAQLFDLFPELRDGLLPASEGTGEESVRSSIRQLLASASMLAVAREIEESSAEKAIEYKQILAAVGEMEPVHQSILWGMYWEGKSMRSLASEWEIDELNIIREHKEILRFLFKRVSAAGKGGGKLRVRPGLRAIAQQMKREDKTPPFTRFVKERTAAATALVLAVIWNALQGTSFI